MRCFHGLLRKGDLIRRARSADSVEASGRLQVGSLVPHDGCPYSAVAKQILKIFNGLDEAFVQVIFRSPAEQVVGL